MIDKNNKIRLIDFGFSEFIGICPIKNIVNYYKATGFLKAPDSNSTSIDRKTYNSDMYSIGQLFLQAFLLKKMVKYKIIDNTIYNTKNNKVIKIKAPPYFIDLIKNMLNPDSKLRYNTTDCLNHIFFTGIKIEKEIKDNVCTNLIQKNLKNYLNNYLNENYLKYNNIEITNNLFEINFHEYIKNTYITKNYIFNLKNNLYLDKINNLLKFLFSLNLSIDTIFNTLIYLKIHNTSEEFKPIVYFYSSIFDSYFDFEKLKSHLDLTNDFNQKLKLFLSNINLDFYPIMLFIQHINIVLQKNNIKSELILLFESLTIKFLFKQIIFSINSNFNIIAEIYSYFNYLFIKFGVSITLDTFNYNFIDVDYTIDDSYDFLKKLF